MDTIAEKERLVGQLESSGDEGSSSETIRRFLQLVRELKTRDSSKVARYGPILLQKHKKKLKAEELWLVYEQVAVACMDIQANKCAQSCVSAVCSAFPQSIRAKRLKAMLFEATDNLSRAESVYDEILSEDPSNDLILKRKIALCKTRGDFVAAIQALNVYLDTFMMDGDAWEELAELYLKVQLYRQAAHCYEELLMLMPTHLTYHLRYADTLYTLGTAQDIKTAQTYYAHALETTQGGNLRALYGICLCASHPKTRASASLDAESLGVLSANAILKKYIDNDSPWVSSLVSILQNQTLLD